MYIEFITQGRENYGTPENPYWKSKPGGEYLLPVDRDALLAAPNKAEFLNNLAQRAIRVLNKSDAMWEQWVVDWQLVESDHYTDFELDQLEYEGRITNWAEIIELPPEETTA